MTIDERSWDEALATLAGADTPVLACHIGPDGDALGSMLALALALRARGAYPMPSFSEPFAVPAVYSFLPGQDLLVKPADVPAAPEVMVTFDCGAYDRLGTLEQNARDADRLVVVDHHVSTEDFGHVKLIDDAAAASAVIAAELLERLGIALDAGIATCLYTGLVTDTGRFQYRNTTRAVHELAGRLLDAGAPHDRITQHIYATHPVGYLRMAARALERMVIAPEMVWSYITQADLHEHGIGLADTDPLIDLVRTADTNDVALVLKQQPDGTYKASMRSKGATNVGAVCARFDGGGHALAAGFSSGETDPGVVARAVAAVLVTGDLPAP
jgi:phosphoesterase RecJ-like protein